MSLCSLCLSPFFFSVLLSVCLCLSHFLCLSVRLTLCLCVSLYFSLCRTAFLRHFVVFFLDALCVSDIELLIILFVHTGHFWPTTYSFLLCFLLPAFLPPPVSLSSLCLSFPLSLSLSLSLSLNSRGSELRFLFCFCCCCSQDCLSCGWYGCWWMNAVFMMSVSLKVLKVHVCNVRLFIYLSMYCIKARSIRGRQV